jgi:hypothetical protein
VGHVAVGEKHKVTGSNGIRRLKNLTWGMVHVAPPPCGSAPSGNGDGEDMTKNAARAQEAAIVV